MATFNPIGTVPRNIIPPGVGTGGLLSGTTLKGAPSSPGWTSATSPKGGSSTARSGAARMKSSTSQTDGAASLKQTLFEALTAMGDVLGAGLPDAPGASRTADGRGMEARLEATIARYFQH